MTEPLIIVGAGLAGWTTAREFRKLDPSSPVLLITSDGGDFYAKPSLSNAYVQQRSPAQLVSTPAARMAEMLKVELRAHTRVTGIDVAQQRLHTDQGDFAWRALVLATGAQAIRLPLRGDAADGVLSINHLDDFTAFHARLDAVRQTNQGTPPRVLIMGAGLIGCEFANDLAATGHAVTLVDPAPLPMATLLPAPASEALQAALGSLGVQWHLGSTVTSIHRAAASSTSTEHGELVVELADGHQVRADLVLSAIGLRSDTALAQAAGLACERGILVDAALQTSAPNVYALGDNSQYASGRTLPYVMPIMNAARALANTLNGQRTEVVFPLMPVGIKTPALPVVVAPPPPGTAGAWQAIEPGVWQFHGNDARVRGFVLTGAQTSRRLEQSKLVAL